MKIEETVQDRIKKKKNRLLGLSISVLLTVVWMFVIFAFSGQSGEASTSQSDKLLELFLWICPFEVASEYYDFITFFIRKAAHFAEYAILGILYMADILLWGKIHRFRISITTLAVMIYAITDEIHQSMVAGRTPAIRDVCIDTAGGFAGAALCLLIVGYYIKKKRSREDDC